MYTITCDGYTLHDLTKNMIVFNCECKLEVNKTGSLVFYIAKNHPNIDRIKKHMSEIILYEDDEDIFHGRVLNTETDINNLTSVQCEGELSYLLDSIQRAVEYHLSDASQNVIKTYLEKLIAIHNNQVSDDKKFRVGQVTVTDPNNYLYRISNYENTLNIINDRLIDRLGGYIHITHENGERVLNYLNEPTEISNQTIEFGKNIVNLTQSISGENIYTALIPLGCHDQNVEESKLEKRITIAGLPDETSGTIVKCGDYIYDSEAVKKYGWIWRVEKWSDVTLPQNLLSKAKVALSNLTSSTMYIELTAIDLHKLDVSIKSLRVGDKVLCISAAHYLNEWFFVKAMSIDIHDPTRTVVTLCKYVNSAESEHYTISSGTKSNEEKIKNTQSMLSESIPTYTYVDDCDRNVKNWVSDNYISRSEVDLSDYAKTADVNAAFNQLASAIEGV